MLSVFTRYPNGTFYSRKDQVNVKLADIQALYDRGQDVKVVCSTSFNDITTRYFAKRKSGRAPRADKLLPCEMCGREVLQSHEDTVCKPCDRDMRREQKQAEALKLASVPERTCRMCARKFRLASRYFHCERCVPLDDMETEDVVWERVTTYELHDTPPPPPPPASTKTCCRCGETKPSSAFGRNVKAPDLLNYACKPCAAAIERENKARRTQKGAA